jgi:hypothetical protein
MSESTGLPPGDPLSGSAIAGRRSFGYDMPDDLGGGFVCGELLLRSDGVLLRRYGGSSLPRRAGHLDVRAMGRGVLVDRRNGPPASRDAPESPRT